MKKFLLASVSAVALLLQGCQNVPSTPTSTSSTTTTSVASGLNDASLIASAIAADAPSLAQLSGASAASINQYASAVASGFSAMSQATTASAQGSAMQVIEANANALIAQAANSPAIPASVQADLQSVEVLLPVAEAAFGIVQTLQGAAPSPMPTAEQIAAARLQLARHKRA